MIVHHEDDGYLRLVCFCSRYRRRDGTCATQRVVLDRLADPDTINRTLVEHETKSGPARALGQGGT